MEQARLGRTELRVSRIAFGGGPIPSLMTVDDRRRQLEVVRHALEMGVNWFDTAATYGDGQSERSLGEAMRELGDSRRVHIASKVRIMPEELHDIVGAVRRSLNGSLERLGLESLTLLQLHNSITSNRGDESTSLAPADVLGPVLEELRRAQSDGQVQHLGLTGIGQADALRQVVASGAFDTIQIPFNLVNPTAGYQAPETFAEADYGNLIADCGDQDMGVFAIRVYAGGALLGLPPAAHTYRTKFFPLDLYERDVERAARLQKWFGDMSLTEGAIRFTLSHPNVTSAIVGFSEPDHIDEAVEFQQRGALPAGQLEELLKQLF